MSNATLVLNNSSSVSDSVHDVQARWTPAERRQRALEGRLQFRKFLSFIGESATEATQTGLVGVSCAS